MEYLYRPNGTFAYSVGPLEGDWLSATFWGWGWNPSDTWYFKIYGNAAGADTFWYRVGLFYKQ